MVFLFSIPSMVDFPYRMEDFDMQFEFSDVIALVCLFTICWFCCRDKIVEGPGRC